MTTRQSMSSMMTKLYGAETAQAVFARLQELDPEFNALVQTVAYDRFWGRDGLPVREKSLITVVALLGLGLAEQIRIHSNGFLASGGTPEELAALERSDFSPLSP